MPISPPPLSLLPRLVEVTRRVGPLGFIGFGGPQVHVVLFRRLFVLSDHPWLDPLTFADLFALSGSLPGPGSTQLLFSIALVRAGALAGWLAFLLWSLPGALGMFLLSLAVKHIPTSLPPLILALLTGLNSAAVGLIFLAAYKLTQLTATDSVTRVVLLASAAVGVCYNTTWLFPVLTVAGGVVTFLWDLGFVQDSIRWGKSKLPGNYKKPDRVGNRGQEVPDSRTEEIALEEMHRSEEVHHSVEDNVEMQAESSSNGARHSDSDGLKPTQLTDRLPTPPPETSTLRRRQAHHVQALPSTQVPLIPDIIPTPINFHLSIAQSLLLLAAFVGILVTVVVLSATLMNPPRALKLFSNLFVAGTILFGGGPVVIPLLQGYIVNPGWVSTQDFLFGFAILQAFPGPNFNFAVFLGALSLPHNPVLGGILGFVAIFSPGLILKFALLPTYGTFREKKATRSVLKGLNSAASGLVWTAIFRLWKVGLLTADSKTGSLDASGYWVSVAGMSFAASEWFSMPPLLPIMGGVVAGVMYGVVKGIP